MKRRGNFDDAFRAWASRPAGVDVRRLVSAVRGQDHAPALGIRLRPVWATLAAVAFVLASGASWWSRTQAPRETPPPLHATGPIVPSPESDVVVVWIDDETPVYMFLNDATER
jgi:hypothetical protein